MIQFLVRRIIFAALTFFAIVTVVFFLVRLAPGGPFDGERRLPPQRNVQCSMRLTSVVSPSWNRHALARPRFACMRARSRSRRTFALLADDWQKIRMEWADFTFATGVLVLTRTQSSWYAFGL